jgi:hypothetical protein
MIKSTFANNFSKIALAVTTFSIVGACLSAPASASTLIFQDDFDKENNSKEATKYENFAKWNVTKGSVDLIGNENFKFIPGYVDGLYIDLDGTTGSAGRLETKEEFTYNAGDIFDLSFQLAGSQKGSVDDSVEVSLGNMFNETITLSPDKPLTTYTRTIKAKQKGSMKLAFAGVGGDDVGLLLDNVSLSRTLGVQNPTTSVNEPTSGLSILTIGIFGAVLCIRKKQAEAQIQG